MLPVDRYDRTINYLRVSVTDRCNFRCPYCMPKEIFGPGHVFLRDPQLMSLEEITRIVAFHRTSSDGATLEIDDDAMQLVANRPVAFRLYSSLSRTEDALGDVVAFAPGDDSMHQHAPLHAVIRFGKKTGERLIPVKIGARLTEVA